MTDAEFAAFVDHAPWQDARSESNPHQYTLRHRVRDQREFRRAVLKVREEGFDEFYWGSFYSYFIYKGHKYWTMGAAVEFTVVLNRKLQPREDDTTIEQELQPNMTEQLPQIFTSRYFNVDLLSSDQVMPVRISLLDPVSLLGELPYPLEHSVRELQPEFRERGEWPKFSPRFWRRLDETGTERILLRLQAIAAQSPGKPLCLLCFEDVRRPQQCHRVIVSQWWYEQTGWKMPEITDAGEVLEPRQLHRQVAPFRPL
jgi:hypothetical protein